MWNSGHVELQIPVIDVCSSCLNFFQIFIHVACLITYITFIASVTTVLCHEMYMKFKLILHIVFCAFFRKVIIKHWKNPKQKRGLLKCGKIMTSMYKHFEKCLSFCDEQHKNKLQQTKISLKDVKKRKISLIKSKQQEKCKS